MSRHTLAETLAERQSTAAHEFNLPEWKFFTTFAFVLAGANINQTIFVNQ